MCSLLNDAHDEAAEFERSGAILEMMTVTAQEANELIAKHAVAYDGFAAAKIDEARAHRERTAEISAWRSKFFSPWVYVPTVIVVLLLTGSAGVASFKMGGAEFNVGQDAPSSEEAPDAYSTDPEVTEP